MQLTKDELCDIIEDSAYLINTGSWRHGRTETYVFPKDDEFWSVTIEIHPSEGWQLPSVIDAIQVTPLEVYKIDWKRVSDAKVIGTSLDIPMEY